MSAGPLRILVLCTGNSARSQLAEGLLRAMGGEAVEAASAGSRPSRVHPLAIQAASEIGLDLSAQRSKHLDELRERPFDIVLTVCDNAAESCPIFPGPAERVHWSLPDPAAVDDPLRALGAFREVRDDLRRRLDALLAERGVERLSFDG